MAITNNEIIAMNIMMLISEGKMNANEELHTFARWKSMGYSVKKGEHAVAKFAIWKYASAKSNDDESTEECGGKMFMKVSCWFTSSQVEKIDGVRNVKAKRPNYKKHTTESTPARPLQVLEDEHHAIFCNF